MDIEKAKGRRHARMRRLQEKFGQEQPFIKAPKLSPAEEKAVLKSYGINERPKADGKINEA